MNKKSDNTKLKVFSESGIESLKEKIYRQNRSILYYQKTIKDLKIWKHRFWLESCELGLENQKLKDRCNRLEKDKRYYTDKYSWASKIIGNLSEGLHNLSETDEISEYNLPSKSSASDPNQSIDKLSDEEINKLIEEKRKKRK